MQVQGPVAPHVLSIALGLASVKAATAHHPAEYCVQTMPLPRGASSLGARIEHFASMYQLVEKGSESGKDRIEASFKTHEQAVELGPSHWILAGILLTCLMFK
jgi:hypothetical protein